MSNQEKFISQLPEIKRLKIFRNKKKYEKTSKLSIQYSSPRPVETTLSQKEPKILNGALWNEPFSTLPS